MMVNPTKRQKELIKIFEEEVAPWCYVDKKTGDIKISKTNIIYIWIVNRQ